MNLNKLQKFFIRSVFKSNAANDINTAKRLFNTTFNININLSKEELNKEKHLGLGIYNKLDIISLCKKISDEDKNVKVNSIDIFYDYINNKNKKESREEKVIVLTTDLMKEKLFDEKINNYFIDITYKIIPKTFKRYKMMTITGTEKDTNITFICALILLKYEDKISFYKIFKYLNEIFSFNPKVVHIDFSKALRSALLTENLFKSKPIIIHCFFHFVQNIVKNMKKNDLIKNKINKYSFEIIKNVEILCFLPKNSIESYSKFLKSNLKEKKEISFYNYLKKNWIDKEYEYYNYYELFNNSYLSEGIEHFYASNNIEESLHNKLNMYIPNKRVTNHNFIISLKNVISNYETPKEKITLHDYITKSLVYYSKTIKKNKYKWLDYETFKNIEKKIITEENAGMEINNVINIIQAINKIDLNEKIDIKLNFNEEDFNNESKNNKNDIDNKFSEDDFQKILLNNIIILKMNNWIIMKMLLKMMEIKFLIYMKEY